MSVIESVVMMMIDAAVKLIVELGQDPKTEIVKILDAHPMVLKAKLEIQDELNTKFPE